MEHAAILRKNPGKWARILEEDKVESAQHRAYAMRSGKYVAFRPAGSFEATLRGGEVYARFVGDSVGEQ